ncbi:MAG: hypothetical protein AAFR87_18250 [Bacteroidota bacterium]
MRFYILLGASGSLSTSMAEQLLSTSNELFFASPDENQDLRKFARMRQLALNFENLDTTKAKKTKAWMEKILANMEEEDWKEVSLILMTGEGSSEIKTSTLLVYCKTFQTLVQEMDKEKRIFMCGAHPDTTAKAGSAHHQDALLRLIHELEESQKNQRFPLKYSSISLDENQTATPTMSNSAQENLRSPELLACELVKLLQADDFGKEAALRLKDLI